jgi:cytochrome c oxidase subunit 2
MGGLFGSQRSLEGGRSVVADYAYLRKAIVEPGAELVSGYGNLMPASFGDLLSEDDISNLIAYLSELGND